MVFMIIIGTAHVLILALVIALIRRRATASAGDDTWRDAGLPPDTNATRLRGEGYGS